MNIKKLISSKIIQYLKESQEYKVIDREAFSDALSNLSTLDLEDGQVRYPRIDGRNKGHVFGGKLYDLYVLDRDSLPDRGLLRWL